jgi:hypothetical protein
MLYYAFTVFLSAFLLFQVQPMIAKYILPWFGGTPAVWTTTMLFFQTMLTGGYAYASWLVGKLNESERGKTHLGLICASLMLLLATGLAWSSPITPDTSWRPQGVSFPVWEIFKILAASVGLPYFLLATNSPLMQVWFSRSHPGRSPYRLYALSNIGSLLALVSYPVLIEPSLALRTQGTFWSLGYAAFAALAALGAIKTMRRVPGSADSPLHTSANSLPLDPPPSARIRALWIGLAACASILLLATTSQITQEVAVIPFLWVLPLTIYLLTFILCFDSARWYSRTVFTIAFFVISALYAFVLAKGPGLYLLIQIGIYSLLLFVGCMICHGELVNLKPHPRYLTSFYLMISIGGAMGGVAVTLIAPYLFRDFWELPIGLLICAILLLVVTIFKRLPAATLRVTRNTATVLAGAIVLLGGILFYSIKATTFDTLLATRNFYGVLRVNETDAATPYVRAYRLTHGAIVHGFQFEDSEIRRFPTAYYAENSGIGLAFLNHPERPGPLRVGVLGLGIGTLAAYAQAGDNFRFYEINPDVIRLAEGEGGYFTFLKDCPAQVQVISGDARISLEQELAAGQSQHFDLLALDTFNGDSIPVHLLTRQALEVYLQHLQPEGILALHISNNYLDLRPVVYNLADDFRLDTAVIETPGGAYRTFPSLWMLVTHNRDFLNQSAIASRSSPRRPGDTNGFRLWTDDYSNLFQILR